VHRKNGLIFIYTYVPGTEALRWLRFDTLSSGLWRMFPHRFAKASELRMFNRRILKGGVDGELNDPTFARIEFS